MTFLVIRPRRTSTGCRVLFLYGGWPPAAIQRSRPGGLAAYQHRSRPGGLAAYQEEKMPSGEPSAVLLVLLRGLL